MMNVLRVTATLVLFLGLGSASAQQLQQPVYDHPITPDLASELWETTFERASRFLPNGEPYTWQSTCGDLSKYPYDCKRIELKDAHLESLSPDARTTRLANERRVRMVNAREKFSSSGFIAFRQGKAVALRVDQYLEMDPELYAGAFGDIVVRAKALGWTVVPNKPGTSADSAEQQMRSFEAGNTKVELLRRESRLVLFYSKAH